MQGFWLVAFLVQWVLILFLTILMIGVLRSLASLQEFISQSSPDRSRFELGEQVSNFSLIDLQGNSIASQSLLGHGQKVLLVFLNSTCGSCSIMTKQLAELAK